VVEHTGPERRREFVQDVAADGMPDEIEAKPEENSFTAGA
jgi:hypothetical protein